MINGSLIAKRPLKERKKLLETFFKEIAQSDQDISFQIVIPYENETELWDNVKKANGEVS
ncbi:hypothetical protein KHA80_20750 [Anaerobacillus sp. HL2]|nr:hypothetical protein KHA80_20750 [Anaerobacillus sp. HL2]